MKDVVSSLLPNLPEIHFYFVSFAMGIGAGLTSFVARAFDAGDIEKAGRIAANGPAFSIVIYVLLAAAGFINDWRRIQWCRLTQCRAADPTFWFVCHGTAGSHETQKCYGTECRLSRIINCQPYRSRCSLHRVSPLLCSLPRYLPKFQAEKGHIYLTRKIEMADKQRKLGYHHAPDYRLSKNL